MVTQSKCEIFSTIQPLCGDFILYQTVHFSHSFQHFLNMKYSPFYNVSALLTHKSFTSPFYVLIYNLLALSCVLINIDHSNDLKISKMTFADSLTH